MTWQAPLAAELSWRGAPAWLMSSLLRQILDIRPAHEGRWGEAASQRA